MVDMKYFGYNLRKNRKRRRLSQAEMGELLGVSQRLISGWETGTRQPRWWSVAGIARALGVHSDELIAPPKERV